jgi:putative tricarboxylic transport membrane protein
MRLLRSCYNPGMRAASLISNATWVLLGLAVCVYAVRLRLWDSAGPASGFLPFFAGLVVGIAGLVLLIREWAGRPVGRSPRFWRDAAGRTRVALVIVALVAMALLMPILGFLVAAFLVMTFLLGLTERRRLGSSIALAAASSVFIYWLFASLLQVRLPPGLLGF